MAHCQNKCALFDLDLEILCYPGWKRGPCLSKVCQGVWVIHREQKGYRPTHMYKAIGPLFFEEDGVIQMAPKALSEND